MTQTLTPTQLASRNQYEAATPTVSAWVDASAGSGKTQVLVQRVLRLLLAGVAPHKILCLTFTKAAAANMALRLGRILSSWSTMPEGKLEIALSDLTGSDFNAETMPKLARTLFVRTLDAPGGLQFQTIHSFCQSVLARFPLESGVPVGFTVLEDRAAQALLDEARLGTYLKALKEGTTTPQGEALQGLLHVMNGEDVLSKLADIPALRDAYTAVLEKHHGFGLAVAALWKNAGFAPNTTYDDYLSAFCANPPKALADAQPLANALRASKTKTDTNAGDALHSWLAASPAERLEQFEALYKIFITSDGTIRKTCPTKKFLENNSDLAKRAYDLASALLECPSAARTLATTATSAQLLVLAEAMLSSYDALKQQHSALDFDDLIKKTAALIADVGTPWVLYKLDGGLDHVLVDEAQDTNAAQWSILSGLTSEFFAGSDGRRANDPLPPTVFAVGDYKQSIFSFQGADPESFTSARDYYAAQLAGMKSQLHGKSFNVSFRTAQPVLDLVDQVFALPEAREGLHLYAHHTAARAGRAGHIEVWPLLRDEKDSIDRPSVLRMADAVADEIERLVASTPMHDQGRPLSYGDILVLVRTRSQGAPAIVKACKRRGIPISGLDRMVLSEQLAVADTLALIKFLLMPEDDLTLACLLKSPFIGLTEDALFQLAHPRGKDQSLWAYLSETAEGDVSLAQARAWLATWLGMADYQTPYGLLSACLAAPCPRSARSGRHALVQQLGEEAQDALDELLGAALTYEQEEAPSLQGFITWLARSDIEVKRQLDQVTGQVRLMTVHGSKGLEAPVVILADKLNFPDTKRIQILPPEQLGGFPLAAPNAGLQSDEARARRATLQARALEEYHRLLYVALTRAEERLIVMGWTGSTAYSADAPKPWFLLIEAAMQAAGAVQDKTGKWILSAPQTAPITAKKDHTAQEATPLPEPLPAWLFQPAPDEPRPSKPLTASAELDDEEGLSPLCEGTEWRFNRGHILHRLLQTLPDLKPEVRKQAGLAWLAGQDIANPAALVDEVLKVINAPEHAFLFGPQSRPEVPLTGTVGTFVVAAQIDRLAILDDCIWIIDYKTNRPPAKTVDEVPLGYLQQLARYKALVSQIYPQKPIHCALLWTNIPRLMPIPAEMLKIL